MPDDRAAKIPTGELPEARREASGRPGIDRWPLEEAEIGAWTDQYFRRTRAAVERFGDCRATYAVFMRRPVISAPRLALDWLNAVLARRGAEVEIDLRFEEGKWVGAGEPIMYITGSFQHAVVDASRSGLRGRLQRLYHVR